MYVVYLFLYFVYLVSADPDIGDIDGKQVVVNKVFIWL